MIDWNQTHAAIWRRRKECLRPVKKLDTIRLDDLLGIDRQKQCLIDNTERFLAGKPANNAAIPNLGIKKGVGCAWRGCRQQGAAAKPPWMGLRRSSTGIPHTLRSAKMLKLGIAANNVLLWGLRGTGKSSLIKALLNEYKDRGLRVIEVDKQDLIDLPEIVDDIREQEQRFIVYCDDLSFEADNGLYTALKSVMEGSIELPPENVLLYATSNRRHLMPEQMRDNLDTRLVDGEVHYSDAVEQKISLSDRFGLWLSFYPPHTETFLEIVDSLFAGFEGDRDLLHQKALDFAKLRASKSGRTTKQFYNAYSE